MREHRRPLPRASLLTSLPVVPSRSAWDRQPYLTDVKHPGAPPTYNAALTTIRNNFVIANYGASQGVDNDDGSSWCARLPQAARVLVLFRSLLSPAG